MGARTWMSATVMRLGTEALLTWEMDATSMAINGDTVAK